MYLKSLEMQGFKSFADKTVLTFDRAMSAVVGPNGSGKSNIADAIRWVLGEQSTRTLRGSRMEDVIFGGTERRGQVGFAEVSLILDNGDGALPIDSAEVMVTRRYYRSGESEYYINRSAVRLRDIHELFMDTGLGRDGYSIIGQGRIDEILSAKSGDRREIFEEAAGISKYRYRKEEAERKLAATNQNLLRVSDKLGELELTVGPLKEQAETAKKYLNLRDELRIIEISLWTAQLARLAETSAKTKNDFAAINEEYEMNHAALDEIYTRSEKLAEEMRACDVDLEHRRASLGEAEVLQREAVGEAELAESRAAGHAESAARIRREMGEQAEREQSLESQIAERESRAAEAEGERDAAETELSDLSEKIAALASEAGALEERADALEAMAAETADALAASAVELSALETAKSELEARTEQLAAQLASREELTKGFTQSLADKDRELEALAEEKQSLQNVIGGYELRLKTRRQRLEKLQETDRKRNEERSALLSRVTLLREMQREYEGFGKAVRTVMHERDRFGGVYGTLAELIEVDDDYTVAVETALGGALQNIVVDTPETARSAMDYLKRTDGGRATFLPVSVMRGSSLNENLSGEPGFIGIASDLVRSDQRYRGILLYSLGRTAVARDVTSAIAISKKHSQRFRIVTLDGQVVNAGGSMTGGSLARSTGILSRANELSRLEGELSSLEEQIKKSSEELRTTERDVNAASYESDVARDELRAAEEKILRAEGERSTIAAQLESVTAAADAAEAERQENARRIAELGAELAAKEERRRVLTEKQQEIAAKLSELRDDRSGLGGRRGELTERMQSLREARMAAAAEAETLRSSVAELRRLSESYGGDRARREAEIRDYEQAEARERALAVEKRKLAQERDARCTEIRDGITEATAKRMSLEAERTASDRELQEKNSLLLKLERERGRLEQKVSEATIEERQIADKLWESYELTPVTAADLAREITSITAARTKANGLKREMSALGEVNVGAIEEYARISERYEFLSSQYKDISGAAEELQKIIGEITGKMKEVFAVEFRRINESFGETFTEIFGGGKASLSLEDEEDILNCGIEIKVQPPGKALKTITLLSGGEKAFVAIALYFAILKVRPTPFCVLDEVDTALDDINVRRFADYMCNMDGSTQFILVTHKRGTMERCDVLYGVTMPTPGVSRVLALDMHEVERELGIRLK